PANMPKFDSEMVYPDSSLAGIVRDSTCWRRRWMPARTPCASSMSALRSAGTNRPSSVSTAMPTSTCGCSVRESDCPSNQALSAGTALHAATIARIRRAVMSCLPIHACRSASSTSVVGTTCACASAMTRAMFRRTPLSCSGWPVAATPGGWVRMGLPEAETGPLCPPDVGAAMAASFWSGAPPVPAACPEELAAVAAPTGADPSAAACFTSAMVTVPSGPVARTRVMSTLSLRAIARTAGIAWTPPTATAASACTFAGLCIAPPTVPAASRASPLGAGAPSSEIAPPSSEATTLSSGAGSSLPTLCPPPPWWWPVSWPSARCGRFGSTSNSASMVPVTITSPGPPASLSTLPETGEGTSTTAFAVSMDTRFSSRRMVSPSLTYHSTMVASGRPSPRSGRRNFLLIGTASLRVGQGALRRGDDLLHAGEELHLQAEQRDVGVVAGDALDRGDQVVHAFLGQARGDLGSEAGGPGGLVHDHAAAGLGHRLGDGVEVERGQRGDVDDFRADAF